MADTIFALSSGAPPAAIALIRISGPHARDALARLAGKAPQPRRATYAKLKDSSGSLLDRALVLWLPGPHTATGEDVVELHCHGGRALVAAVEAELELVPQLRRATSGEFTRRAFVNGRLDLAEAEGLADLLAAETELQRQGAMAMAGGAVSRQVEDWRGRVLALSAQIEAALDFSDEDDVAGLPPDFAERVEALGGEIGAWLARPRAEALREGFRVVLAGPPNSGKSTLFNVLVEKEAAITAPVPGTTRDVLTQSVAMDGVPFQFFDTAGIRDGTEDAIEAIGIDRARSTIDAADLVLWLGGEEAAPEMAWDIEAQCDRDDRICKVNPRHRLSAITGQGIADLRRDLVAVARASLPRPGTAALNERQHGLLGEAKGALLAAVTSPDPLIAAECLRLVRVSFDALLGRTTTEDMLDALFGRFCIGK